MISEWQVSKLRKRQSVGDMAMYFSNPTPQDNVYWRPILRIKHEAEFIQTQLLRTGRRHRKLVGVSSFILISVKTAVLFYLPSTLKKECACSLRLTCSELDGQCTVNIYLWFLLEPLTDVRLTLKRKRWETVAITLSLIQYIHKKRLSPSEECHTDLHKRKKKKLFSPNRCVGGRNAVVLWRAVVVLRVTVAVACRLVADASPVTVIVCFVRDDLFSAVR